MTYPFHWVDAYGAEEDDPPEPEPVSDDAETIRAGREGYPQAPKRGDCAHCGCRQLGLREVYCSRSGRAVDSPKALRYCSPEPLGKPYLPVALRP